jgi:hypothetical protein
MPHTLTLTPAAPEQPTPGRGVPLWVFLVAAALLIGVGAVCREQLADPHRAAAMFDDALGRPLDFPGQYVKCPDCPRGLLIWQEGYHYRCELCGVALQARVDVVTSRVEFAR